MNRLTYPQKFGLISLLFSIPLLYVIISLNIFQSRQIAFSSKEQEGIKYLVPLRVLLQDTVEQQFLIEDYLQGDTQLEATINAKNAQFESDFEALRAVDAKYQTLFNTQSAFAALDSEWNFLNRRLLQRTQSESAAFHKRFIGALRTMIQYIGDQSNLILDPDLDTYYLMDITLLKIPEAQEYMSTIDGISYRILSGGINPQNDFAELGIAKNLLQNNNTEIRHAMETVFSESADPDTKPNLEPSYRSLNQLFQALNRTITDRLLISAASKPTPSEYKQQRDGLSQAFFGLWDTSIVQLDDLLQQRVSRFKQQRLFVLMISALIVAFVIYLLIGFYRAVMKTIGGFQAAAQHMLSGKHLETVDVDTRDELGHVAVSFNAIASALIESSQQRQAVVEHASEGIMIVDQAGIIRDANPISDAMFGTSIKGKSIFDLINITQNQMQRNGVLDEYIATKADGSWFPVETSIGSMTEGSESMWVVFLRNISIRRAAEAERNRLQAEMMRGQEAMMVRLSAPLIPLSRDVVVVPLVGNLSGERLASISGLLPHDIQQLRAKIVLLDMTGVPRVDAAVVPQFGQLAKGIRLLGARLIVTGIQPEVADALVQAGIDLSTITTYSTLQRGVAAVLQSTV